jgi:hypothetical protein
MRKTLYYLMLLLFFVCIVWNAVRKRDSIMGTEAAVAGDGNLSELVAVGSLP